MMDTESLPLTPTPGERGKALFDDQAEEIAR
jgi:hypothetical protein